MIEKYVPKSLISKLFNYDRVVVGGLIKDKDSSKLLFLKRSLDEFMPNVWEIPSGGIEEGENMFMALSREIREETGLKIINVLGFVGALDYQAGSKKCIQLNFNVSCSGNVNLSREHSDFIWTDVEPFKKNFDQFMLRILNMYFHSLDLKDNIDKLDNY